LLATANESECRQGMPEWLFVRVTSQQYANIDDRFRDEPDNSRATNMFDHNIDADNRIEDALLLSGKYT